MKMNNHIYLRTISFLLLVGLAISLGSCEDVFDKSLARVSDSRETFENILADATKVEGLFNSCYAGIEEHRYNIFNWVSFESLTDNAYDEKTGGSLGRWYFGRLSPSESCLRISTGVGNFGTSGSYWGVYWGAIRACNTLINNMDNVTAPIDDLKQEDRDIMVDEARILRAFYHIRLLGMYGPIPFVTEAYSVNYDGWKTMTRPNYHDVAVAIANDLQEVIDNAKVPLKRDFGSINDKYRVPLSFAYGLKSRVLLYSASPLNNPEGDEAKYALAAEAAKQFIDLGIYSLEPFENTKKALYNSQIGERVEEVEIIWRATNPFRNLSNISGLNLKETVPSIANQKGFRVGETPTQEIVDCYELKTGELIIENYDETHANPTFTTEALAAGYDDEKSPYANRDDRFYRDVLFNGNYFGQTYDGDSIVVYTYQELDPSTNEFVPVPGTGNNGPTVSGLKHQTYTGYYYAKDRNPRYYGRVAHNEVCDQHSVLMRYAEIYLNFAEALCGSNQLDAACDALDMTRLRANQPPIKTVAGFTLNKEWLMKRIYNERRVELVLEDHRFFDVRRWDVISNQNHNVISGMLAKKVSEGAEPYTYSRYQVAFTWACHNERYKVLPIPAVDQKKMPLMLQPIAWQ